jgi:hypothetical protein
MGGVGPQQVACCQLGIPPWWPTTSLQMTFTNMRNLPPTDVPNPFLWKKSVIWCVVGLWIGYLLFMRVSISVWLLGHRGQRVFGSSWLIHFYGLILDTRLFTSPQLVTLNLSYSLHNAFTIPGEKATVLAPGRFPSLGDSTAELGRSRKGSPVSRRSGSSSSHRNISLGSIGIILIWVEDLTHWIFSRYV